MEIDRQRLQDDAYRQEVLTALMHSHQNRIFRYCVTRLGEVYGDEVAQEVFVTAWEKLTDFRQEAAISTWLTGIAKNKCRQVFRNRQRRQAIARTSLDDIRQHTHAEGPQSPEDIDTAPDQAQFARLAQCLGQLRTEEQILVRLRYMKGLPISDITEVIGKSEAAVRKQLYRALQRLRELMQTAVTEET